MTPRTQAFVNERQKEVTAVRRLPPRKYKDAEEFIKRSFLASNAPSQRELQQKEEAAVIMKRFQDRKFSHAPSLEVIQRALLVPRDRPPEVCRLNFLDPSLMDDPDADDGGKKKKGKKSKKGGKGGGKKKKK
jgi:hypothetical protein